MLRRLNGQRNRRRCPLPRRWRRQPGQPPVREGLTPDGGKGDSRKDGVEHAEADPDAASCSPFPDKGRKSGRDGDKNRLPSQAQREEDGTCDHGDPAEDIGSGRCARRGDDVRPLIVDQCGSDRHDRAKSRSAVPHDANTTAARTIPETIRRPSSLMRNRRRHRKARPRRSDACGRGTDRERRESGAVEIGPEARKEDEFGIGRLPEQEIRQALLAARADDQVRIRNAGRVERRADRLLADRPADRSRRRDTPAAIADRTGDFVAAP